MAANPVDGLYAIILAAGNSSRLGKPKQLLQWRGLDLLQHTINNVKGLLPQRVIVVLGANADKISAVCIVSNVTLVVNSNWQSGLASSIRAGMATLPGTSSAVLLLVCDQPLLRQSHLNELINTWQQQPDKIVASTYNDTIGTPAIFPKEFFLDLNALEGETGAKTLISKYPEKLVAIPLPEAKLDIDTLEDYQQLLDEDNDEE